jgi:hypothetical protein
MRGRLGNMFARREECSCRSQHEALSYSTQNQPFLPKLPRKRINYRIRVLNVRVPKIDSERLRIRLYHGATMASGIYLFGPGS